jgi:hypothetical protein
VVAPVVSEIFPVVPLLVVPVLKLMCPLTPRVPASGVFTMTAPLLLELPDPVVMLMDPPVRDEVVPAMLDTSPPVFSLPAPTVKSMLPPRPTVPVPVVTTTCPDDPALPPPVDI